MSPCKLFILSRILHNAFFQPLKFFDSVIKLDELNLQIWRSYFYKILKIRMPNSKCKHFLFPFARIFWELNCKKIPYFFATKCMSCMIVEVGCWNYVKRMFIVALCLLCFILFILQIFQMIWRTLDCVDWSGQKWILI